MNNKKKIILGVILFCLFVIVSCKKEPEQSCGTCPVGGSVNSTPVFSYVKNNGSTVTADSAFFIPVSKTIVAYYQGYAHKVNIKTASLAAGTYSFTSSANTLSYVEATFTYIASGGSINITSNTNSKLSGNFVSNGSGGGITSLTGQFTDIPSK